ncbi:hypothetical protein ACJ41O_006878 [Fusarium nematophilum]
MFKLATLLLALPLITAAPASVTPRAQGVIAYYSPGLGVCGQYHSNTDMVAAIPVELFDTEDLCGRQIRVRGPAGEAVVTVADACPGAECPSDSLDLSPAAYQQAIGDLSLGRVSASWDWESTEGVAPPPEDGALITRRSEGEITYYNPGLGACGQTHTDGDMVVAVSAALFDADRPCGRQIRVRGDAGEALVTVVDRCGGCAYNDLDLSPVAFQQSIGDLGIGRRVASWDWA